MRLVLGFSCLVMAVGCSDDDKVRHLPDAPPVPDADIDASTFGPVTLTVLQGTEPQSNVRVFFQNADSTLVLETTTGSDGKASAMMMPGGYVTAINPFPNPPQGIQSSDLRTFAGVKPGDQLRLFQRDFSSPPAINVNVVLPIANGAVDYRVSTNCLLGFSVSPQGSGGQPMGTMQLAGCGPTSNLLVEALGSNGQAISSIYKQNVTLTDNGTLDLLADTYTTAPDVTLTYSNLPSTNVVVFNIIRATSLGRIFELNNTAPVSGTGATTTVKIPVISNATAVMASSVNDSPSFHLITEWGAPATSYALDFGGSKLPDYAGGPEFEFAAHKATWSTSGGAVQPDFVRLRAFFGREVPTQNWRWTISAPTANEVVFPVLPSSSTFNPIEGDFAGFDLASGKVPGGYDAVRADILAVDSFQEIVLGASGKAVFSEYAPSKGLAKPQTVPTVKLRGLRPFTRPVR